MRILTKARTAFFEASSDGDDSQVVAVGNLCVLRAFSATANGPATDSGDATFSFYDGDSASDPLLLKYAVPYLGYYVSLGANYGLRSPTFFVPVPGIGIRFSNGMYVEYDLTGALSAELQVVYT
jgi:hypothetical protein